MFCDPLPIGRILGHTGKQQEDAVQSALRQDSVYPARNSIGLLRKRGRQVDSSQILQPARQVKFLKRCSSVGTIAPLAAPSSDAATTGSSKVSRHYASKLAGDRGDAVVARRDAPVVGQGYHLCQGARWW